MRRGFLLACLLSVAAPSAVTFVPSEARADDAAVAEAQQRFQEGLDLADAGKHEPARLKFQQAWAVFKSPAVLYNLARTEQLTGHELEALEHFRTFVKLSQTDAKITDAMREKARQNAEDLAKKVGQIEVEVPATARVTIDGKAIESVADPVPVRPGNHRVEATFEGKAKNVTVDCGAGAVVKAKIEFEVSGGFTEPPRDGHSSGWSTGKIVTFGALTAGAIAGGVLFFVFRGAAQGNVDDASNLLQGRSCLGVGGNPICERASTLKDDRDRNVTLGTVSILVGGTLAAGAIATAIFWPSKKSEAARLTPSVAPGYAGASLVGSF